MGIKEKGQYMSEDLMILLFLSILFFGAGGLLFKVFVLDLLRNKQLFKNLNTSGFSEITQRDIIEKLEKYKLSQNGSRSIDTIQRVIGAQKGSNHNRYLCDVSRITRGRKSSQHKSYTMLVDMLPTKIEGEISVRRKLAGIAEKLIEIQTSHATGPGQEITKGLSRDFMSNYHAIAKNKHNDRLPEDVKKILIHHINYFPFNQKKGPISTRLYLSPKGWGIVCNRVTKENNLNQLLRVADELTSVLSKDQNVKKSSNE